MGNEMVFHMLVAGAVRKNSIAGAHQIEHYAKSAKGKKNEKVSHVNEEHNRAKHRAYESDNGRKSESAVFFVENKKTQSHQSVAHKVKDYSFRFENEVQRKKHYDDTDYYGDCPVKTKFSLHFK